MSGLKFVKPIMLVDDNCESEFLSDTKQKITEVITKYKQIDGVTAASVYLRSNTDWTVVNEEEKYAPGSLFKVPILITILKMDELHPGFLNKVVPYTAVTTSGKKINFKGKTIELGKSYSIRELLTYMIKYSDNEATGLLQKHMDSKVLQKLFADLGLEVPNLYASQYLFKAKDYSLFMRMIFNAGYLNIPNSEYAAELLSQCDFNEGIVKGIPAGTKVAHKFGESGTDLDKQLHESAIVYLNDKGYMLTVMTKGKDFKKLSEMIAEISRTVYSDIKSKS
jgi:beta-lactamase class A